MKINLKDPYRSDFKAGYCYKNSEPRRTVILVRYDNSRTSTSYARYLMSCHLGRYLGDDEYVDHINDDKLDDRIDNLQILSPAENVSKSSRKTYLRCICPVCEKEFEVAKKRTFLSGCGNKPYQNCSRSCGGRASHMDDKLLENRFKIIEEFSK